METKPIESRAYKDELEVVVLVWVVLLAVAVELEDEDEDEDEDEVEVEVEAIVAVVESLNVVFELESEIFKCDPIED